MNDRSKKVSGKATEVVASLSRATKRYGNVMALNGVDVELHRGEVVALLGPNGAGKTTLVHLLLGLAQPSSGQARLFGCEPRTPTARMRVGAMLQVSRVPETLKVKEHLRLVSSYYPDPLPLAETVDLAGLGGLEDRQFGRLSGGQRQRLLFGLAVCGDPDLLFLDEPTTGLDVEARRVLWQTIGSRVREGRSVLLTTHYLEEADVLADRIILLGRGSILAEGTPAEIKARVQGRKLRCRTGLPASVVSGFPGVRSVRTLGDDGYLEVFTGAAEQTLRVLLERDAHLRDLEVRGADLEEAFLHLTGGAAAARRTEAA